MITDSIIIMAAGLSSRMKKNISSDKINNNQKIIADTKSKSLIGFGPQSKPFISFLISNIYESGFRNIYLVVPENSNDFQIQLNKSPESYEAVKLSMPRRLFQIQEKTFRNFRCCISNYGTTSRVKIQTILCL